jgi:hypothetical protein
MLDDAASYCLPDALVPLAAFIKHVDHVVITGDSTQRPPRALSRACNEFAYVLESSLFQAVFDVSMYSTEYKFTLV